MEHKITHTGLTDDQVTESRILNGANILTPPKRDPLWKLFLRKFDDPIIRILLIAVFLSLGVSFYTHHYAETVGIFCAIFLATGVGTWFEWDAGKKFNILNLVNDDTPVKVIRNGNLCEVPKRDIVVGDIVRLETGEEVPADGELLEAISLQIDESCLTGESVPAEKTTDPVHFDNLATYGSNLALKGTKVMDGHLIMRIRTVGDQTEFGKVAREAAVKSIEETPLNQQLEKLAKRIGVVGFGLAAFTFMACFLKDAFLGNVKYTFIQFSFLSGVIISALVALIKVWLPIIYDGFELAGKKWKLPQSVSEGSWPRWIATGILTFVVFVAIGLPFGVNPLDSRSWISIDTAGWILQIFMISVTMIVVAVPEGLPMSVTLSLALSMRKMLKSNNLVRKMHACETMGASTVICTDKTGTLTKNQMKVFNTNFWGLQGESFSGNRVSNLIKEGIAVNSTADLDFRDPKLIKPIGNVTEAALLLWLSDNGINYLPLREETNIIEQLTFSPERKFMATIVDSPLLNKKVLYVKGAPEIVLSKCIEVQFENECKSVAAASHIIEDLLVQYQNQAMRTLGFAYEIIDDDKDRFEYGRLVNSKLTYLGIVAISDPLREDVPDAVRKCLNAGIEVKIVTGDTPGIAREIGKQIGIWSESEPEENMIMGPAFEKLSDDEASSKVRNIKILCRARPDDKLRLVQLLQGKGSVVAVTGDGTSDAPALNHAHVGLSMGSGTSVAKEASDITLIDDSFISITSAVLWGRSIFRNIQRFIIFQLTINVAALIIDFIGAIFWGTLPLTVTQLLWVNLIMDTFAAGALASLPPDPKVMKDKPRDRNSFIVTKDMAGFIFGIGIFFVVLLLGLLYYLTVTDIFHSGENSLTTKELTIVFTFFVMLQFWNMFNAKAFFTKKSAFQNMGKSIGFVFVAAVIFVGQILIVTFGGDVFRTKPITLTEWLIIIASTSLVFWIGEFSRLLKKRFIIK